MGMVVGIESVCARDTEPLAELYHVGRVINISASSSGSALDLRKFAAFLMYAGNVRTVSATPLFEKLDVSTFLDKHFRAYLYTVERVSKPAPPQSVRPLSVGVRLPPSLCPNSMITKSPDLTTLAMAVDQPSRV